MRLKNKIFELELEFTMSYQYPNAVRLIAGEMVKLIESNTYHQRHSCRTALFKFRNWYSRSSTTVKKYRDWEGVGLVNMCH